MTFSSSRSPLSIALTRTQYAVECGGVLIDPTTNLVCLLFNPETSEWRLPMGSPDALLPPTSKGQKPEHGVVGCEPQVHSAHRLITQMTGYDCGHLPPLGLANPTDSTNSSMIIQASEPLALHIEQRTIVPQSVAISTFRLPSLRSKTSSISGFSAVSSATSKKAKEPNDPSTSPNKEATSSSSSSSFNYEFALCNIATEFSTSSGNQHSQASPASPSEGDMANNRYRSAQGRSQYVIMHYYMAWLSNGKPDGTPLSASSATFGEGQSVQQQQQQKQQPSPSVEVTWFKMDTAVQVLTFECDKVALRETIHRLPKFKSSMATMKTLSTKSQENLLAASSSKDQSTTSTAKPSTELLTTSSPTNDQDAKAATESESKTAAKQQTGVGKAVGLSLMDKVATIGKRGILGWSKSKAEFTTTPNTTTSTTSTTSTTTNTTNTTNTTIAATKEASAAETKVVAQKKDLIPKVFSIFSKLVGFQSS